MALDCKVAQRFPGNRKLSKKPSTLSDHSFDDEKELCMNRMYLDVPCMWMVFGYFFWGAVWQWLSSWIQALCIQFRLDLCQRLHSTCWCVWNRFAYWIVFSCPCSCSARWASFKRVALQSRFIRVSLFRRPPSFWHPETVCKRDASSSCPWTCILSVTQYITSFHWAKSEAQQTKTSASNIPKSFMSISNQETPSLLNYSKWDTHFQ